jgi:hypothetical protein
MSYSTFCLTPPQLYSNDDVEINDEDLFFQKTVQALSSVIFIWNPESDNLEPNSPMLNDECNDANFTWRFPEVSLPFSDAEKAKNSSHRFKRPLTMPSDPSTTLPSKSGEPSFEVDNKVGTVSVPDSANSTPDKEEFDHKRRSVVKVQALKEGQNKNAQHINCACNLITPTPSKKIFKSKKRIRSQRSPQLHNCSKKQPKANKKRMPGF